ncbi:MAG: FGGY family carbohydrate kinase [Candidatus Bathyarchaeia archaeon]
MDEALLGIDIGTGGCKATLITLEGEIIFTASREYPTHYPEPGWAEQDPGDWLKALTEICRGMSDRVKRRIIGICIDGQPHTPVFLDERGEVLHPAIPWTDRRSSAQVEYLRRRLPEVDAKRTFNSLNTAFTLPQLLWVKEYRPEVWRRTYRLLIAKDYVRQRIIGEGWFTDPSDALGTYLFDGEAFEWSEGICAAAGIEVEKLPEVKPSSLIVGEVTREASKRFDLPEGVPVVNGAHDPSVENLAAGTVKPGDAFVKLATAGVISVTTREPTPDPKGRTVTYCLPTTKDGRADGWFTKTATFSCGSSYRWFRDLFCQREVEEAERYGKTAFQLMDMLAEEAPPCSEGLVFHPYLIGEGSPYWDPQLKGSFFGATLSHQRSHFCRSILEGVAFSIRDSTSIFQELNLKIREIRLIGGGSASRTWREILCNVLGLKGLRTLGGDSSFGSAILAGVGLSIYRSIEEGAARCVKIIDETHPDPELHVLYGELFKIYKELHDATASISHKLDELARSLPRRQDKRCVESGG